MVSSYSTFARFVRAVEGPSSGFSYQEGLLPDCVAQCPEPPVPQISVHFHSLVLIKDPLNFHKVFRLGKS